MPPVDAAVAGDHAVGRRVAALHRALGEMRLRVDAQLGERARVDEQRDPLARRQLAGRVLARDPLLAAAQPRQRATLVQVLGERAQAAHPARTVTVTGRSRAGRASRRTPAPPP